MSGEAHWWNPQLPALEAKTFRERLDTLWGALGDAGYDGNQQEFLALLEFMSEKADDAALWLALGRWAGRKQEEMAVNSPSEGGRT